MLQLRQSYFLYLIVLSFLFGLAGCEGCNNIGPDNFSITNPGTDLIGLLLDASDGSSNLTDHTIIIPALTSFDLSFDAQARTDNENEEVVAFRIGSPPVVLNPISLRSGRDIIPVVFRDEIVLDVTVWVLDVGSVANTYNDRISEIVDGLAWCDAHWLAERMGVRIGDIQINDVRTDPDAATLRDHESGDDPLTYFDALSADIGEDTDRINLYLTRKVNGSRQYGGALYGDNRGAIGMYAGEVDIPFHQMGEFFGLEPIDGNSNFNSENSAKAIGNLLTRRKYMTEGQVFRAHTIPFSAINDTYNARPGLHTTDCRNADNDVRCPPVEKRIWADGNAFPAN
ncbi:MAG: hypothetical protein AAFP77_27655 [Bacteroidota bacterium]